MKIISDNNLELEEKIKLMSWLNAISNEELLNFVQMLIDKGLIPNADYKFAKKLFDSGVIELSNTLPSKDGNDVKAIYFEKSNCYVNQVKNPQIILGHLDRFTRDPNLSYKLKKEWIKHNLLLHRYTKEDVEEIKHKIEADLARDRRGLDVSALNIEYFNSKLEMANKKDRGYIEKEIERRRLNILACKKDVEFNEELLQEL